MQKRDTLFRQHNYPQHLLLRVANHVHAFLRSFLCFALRILTAHNLWRHLHALVHAHIENMEDLS